MIRPVLPTYDGGIIQRVAIKHAEGQFTFNDADLTPDRLQSVILLGLIRQRSYWQHEGSVLRCKSYDFENGMPTDEFPWDESNFDHHKLDEQGRAILPCGSCIFKDFVADPTSKRGWKQAPCREQFVVPLLVPLGPPDEEDFRGAVVRYALGMTYFQKSSLKPIQEYLTWFKKNRQPAYSHTTALGLNVNIGSGFKYSVPTFRRDRLVEPRAYPAMSALLAATRATLTTPLEPTRAKTGGLLSVSDAEPATTGYTGSFFA